MKKRFLLIAALTACGSGTTPEPDAEPTFVDAELAPDTAPATVDATPSTFCADLCPGDLVHCRAFSDGQCYCPDETACVMTLCEEDGPSCSNPGVGCGEFATCDAAAGECTCNGIECRVDPCEGAP